MKPPKELVRRARWVLWIGALLVVFYLMMRFESVRLPEGSCSPLRSLPAGSRLWIDRWPPAVGETDVVLFRDPGPDGDGALLLGRVESAPDSLDADSLRELESGALWIVGDNSDCPLRDSRLFGPVERDAVEGKLILSF